MRLALALRFALRELRGGMRGLYIFIACIALGVTAMAGVGTVGRAMLSAIGEQGQVILGGDLAVNLVQRDFSADERAFLDGLGRTSKIVSVRAMARAGDDGPQALTELKAIDDVYPMLGSVVIEGGGNLDALLGIGADGVPGAIVERDLLVRLDAKVGDVIGIGNGRVRISGVLVSEPDKAGGGIGFGPRVMVSLKTLSSTGLATTGSLASWRLRILLADPANLVAVADRINAAFPSAGWEIRNRLDAAPGLKQNIERFVQFLSLVGLAALVVGGVGVANAVRAHVDGRQASIAVFKCLGATGGFVFLIYFIQVMLVAALGVAVGLGIGSVLPPMLTGLVARFIAVPLDLTPDPTSLALAATYGFGIAAAFTLLPLGRAHDVSPTVVIRQSADGLSGLPRRGYLVALVVLVAALTGLTLFEAPDRRLAALFLLGMAACFLVFVGIGLAIRAGAARLPHVGPTVWRMAIAALHRPGAATGSVVLSLGLGLTLLSGLAQIDWNLRRQLERQLPAVAPSFFFMDVQNRELEPFLGLLGGLAPDARIVHVPMMRGRIVTLNGKPADEVAVAQSAAWVLKGDRGITYSDTVPENSTLAEGTWWPKDRTGGEPLVSVEADVAHGLGLKLGDTIGVNVMGREITARVANMRKVRWESLGINFFMVFSPDTFRGAPHGHLATLALPTGSDDRERDILKAVTKTFPTVTALRVKDAIEAASGMVRALTDGARLAAAFAFAASVLVLAGALASGQSRRVRDAVILKVLGATRTRLVVTYALEYVVVGVLSALVGLLAGTVIAAIVVAGVMGLEFTPSPLVAGAAAAIALGITVGIGLAGTLSALSRGSAAQLREA